jgi:dGTP triphosphohydrolase
MIVLVLRSKNRNFWSKTFPRAGTPHSDIIASMTEQQAMELYERVMGHFPGLVTDRII